MCLHGKRCTPIINVISCLQRHSPSCKLIFVCKYSSILITFSVQCKCLHSMPSWNDHPIPGSHHIAFIPFQIMFCLVDYILLSASGYPRTTNRYVFLLPYKILQFINLVIIPLLINRHDSSFSSACNIRKGFPGSICERIATVFLHMFLIIRPSVNRTVFFRQNAIHRYWNTSAVST